MLGVSAASSKPGNEKTTAKASTEHFASFFEKISGVLFIIAIEPRGCFRFSAVNRALLEITGLKEHQIVGKRVQEVIPKPSCGLVLEKYREAIRIRQTVKWEETSVYPTGVRHGEVAVTPVFDSTGKATHLFGIVHDITARKTAEEALRKSEKRFRVSLDHSPIVIWHQDKEFKYTWIWNPDPRFDPNNLIGKSAEDILPADEVAQATKIKRRVLRTGTTSREEVQFTIDGKVCFFDYSVEPLRDENGKIQGLVGVAIDITDRKKAEEALRESEARYARAVRATNEGLWEWDIATGNTYLSPRWKALLGFAEDELPDDREIAFYSRLHPDDLPIVEAARREKLERLIPYSVEVRLRMKSGEYRWFQATGQAEADERGKPERISGTMTDITERKETEQALRQSEERFRAVFEQAAVGVGTIDVATDRFLEVNQPYCNITGRTREEMLAGSFIEMTHPDDLRANLRFHERLKSGEITRYTIEKRYIRPDGSIVWGNVHAARIATKYGAPVRLLAVVEDITERKMAEAKYRRELGFNETLVNHTSAIIVLLDDKARMVYVNEATLNLLGYQRAEMINRTPWEVGIMDAAEAARSKDRLSRILMGEDNPPRGVVLKGKDGTLHQVELSSTATRTPEGKPDRIIVTGTDLTERYHLQKEILKISEQEQARIGHNLHDGVGQTMTGVASMLEAFEEELEGEQKARAGRIRQFVQDAIHEVRQMSHSLSPTAVKNRRLGGALLLLAETIRTNHRTGCKLEVDPTIRIEDSEKETHVYRIAQEATSNALRHGGARNITLSLKRHGSSECMLKIEDDGIGFKQRKSGDSHGIGIRVMEYRANCIGGTLDVTSGRLGGVCVICRFPCEGEAPAPEGEKVKRRSKRPAANESDLGKDI